MVTFLKICILLSIGFHHTEPTCNFRECESHFIRAPENATYTSSLAFCSFCFFFFLIHVREAIAIPLLTGEAPRSVRARRGVVLDPQRVQIAADLAQSAVQDDAVQEAGDQVVVPLSWALFDGAPDCRRRLRRARVVLARDAVQVILPRDGGVHEPLETRRESRSDRRSRVRAVHDLLQQTADSALEAGHEERADLVDVGAIPLQIERRRVRLELAGTRRALSRSPLFAERKKRKKDRITAETIYSIYFHLFSLPRSVIRQSGLCGDADFTHVSTTHFRRYYSARLYIVAARVAKFEA